MRDCEKVLCLKNDLLSVMEKKHCGEESNITDKEKELSQIFNSYIELKKEKVNTFFELLDELIFFVKHREMIELNRGNV